jgi:nucleoid DNA-binding protein
MAKNNKAPAKGKGLTKSQVFDELAAHAGVNRKQVAAVFEGLSGLIQRQLKKDGDVFTIPGLLKLRLVKKKAVKGGKVVPNPFKPGETMVTKDKPARNIVKSVALKNLKESIQ